MKIALPNDRKFGISSLPHSKNNSIFGHQQAMSNHSQHGMTISICCFFVMLVCGVLTRVNIVSFNVILATTNPPSIAMSSLHQFNDPGQFTTPSSSGGDGGGGWGCSWCPMAICHPFLLSRRWGMSFLRPMVICHPLLLRGRWGMSSWCPMAIHHPLLLRGRCGMSFWCPMVIHHPFLLREGWGMSSWHPMTIDTPCSSGGDVSTSR